MKHKRQKPPAQFYIGKRKEQIHTQLRLNCSNLNGDLYNNHILDSRRCDCGHGFEDAFHYLKACALYENARTNIIRNTETDDLLKGKTNQTEESKDIFIEVQRYIRATKRFEPTE